MKSIQFIKIYFAVIVLSVLTLHSVQAQESESDPFDRNIVIEREYQPVIQDAGKITTLPEPMQMDIKKEPVVYSDIYQPLAFQKEVVILNAEEQKHEKPVLQEGLLRFGGGNYFNTLLDFVYPIIKNDRNLLDINLSHRGAFGEKQHAFSKLNLVYNHYFKNYDFYAGAGVSHQYFNYYGHQFHGDSAQIADLNLFSGSFSNIPMPDYQEQNLVRFTRAEQTVNLQDLMQLPAYDNVWRYNAHIGLRSLPTLSGGKNDGVMNVDVFKSVNGMRETNYNIQYGYSNPVGKNRIGIDVELSNLFYQESDTTKINFWDYYAVFSMNPYFLMDRNHWFMRIGVKTDVSFIHGRPFNPTPDVAAEWSIIPKSLALYGGVSGSFKVNTLSSVNKENPYMFSDLRLKDTYTPVNPYIGLKLKPYHSLMLDAFLDYRLIKDQYFFVNKEYYSDHPEAITQDYTNVFLNRFNAIYSDANLFRIGGRINFNHKDIVNVHLKGTYNKWNVETENHAWMKPVFEADFTTDIRITPKLTTLALVFYEAGRYAKLGDNPFRMKSKIDINLGANYTINKSFAVFGKLNNLLNRKYQHYYGYDVQGFNFMVGGVIGF